MSLRCLTLNVRVLSCGCGEERILRHDQPLPDQLAAIGWKSKYQPADHCRLRPDLEFRCADCAEVGLEPDDVVETAYQAEQRLRRWWAGVCASARAAKLAPVPV